MNTNYRIAYCSKCHKIVKYDHMRMWFYCADCDILLTAEEVYYSLEEGLRQGGIK